MGGTEHMCKIKTREVLYFGGTLFVVIRFSTLLKL